MADETHLDQDEENVIWSDDPEKIYFKQMMETAGMSRVADGKDLDDSLVGVDTIASLLKDTGGTDDSSLLGRIQAPPPPPGNFAIVGMDDEDLSTIAGDTTLGGSIVDNKYKMETSMDSSLPANTQDLQDYTPPRRKKGTDHVASHSNNVNTAIQSDDETQPETPPGYIQVSKRNIEATRNPPPAPPRKTSTRTTQRTSAKEKQSSTQNKKPSAIVEVTEDDTQSTTRMYWWAAILGVILIAAIGALAVSLVRLRRDGEMAGTGSSGSLVGGGTGPPTGSPVVVNPSNPTLVPIAATMTPVAAPTQAPLPVSGPTEAPVLVPTVAPIPNTAAPTVAATTTAPTMLATTIAPGSEVQRARAELLETIALVSPTSLAALQSVGSLQFMAFDWLANDPNFFDYDDARLIQRWTLAVFYLSLNDATVAGRTAPPFSVRRRALEENNNKDENHSNIDESSKVEEDARAGRKLIEGWLTYDDECTWYSSKPAFSCHSDGTFRSLDIREHNLAGTLPAELSLLSNSLRFIYLNNNQIYSSIPKEYGRLTKLERIQLTQNRLQGSIPPELGALTEMVVLGLGRNNLVGTLPSQLANLPYLDTLGLENNNITGTIASEFGELENLRLFSMEENELFGTIPTELGNLPLLTSLTLNDNDLVGSMPREVCELRSDSLSILAVDCNVVCDCCTECEPAPPTTPLPTTVADWKQPTPFPTVTPATPAPTSSPVTAPPTSAPTAVQRTSSPTTPPTVPPTASPTAEPVAVVTNRPTDEPTRCPNSISSLDGCYLPGEQIFASFENCRPERDDWIGIYPSNGNPADLGEALLWMWSCGQQTCQGAVERSTVVFSGWHLGGTRDSVWPMAEGEYRVHILRRNPGGPYSAFASSDTFRVSFSC